MGSVLSKFRVRAEIFPAMGSVLSKFRVRAEILPIAELLDEIFPIAELPDDILLFWLARFPWKSHLPLSHVCKQWRDMLRSDECHSFRRYYNFAKPLIFTLCEDKRQSSLCYVLDPGSSPRLWKNLSIPPGVSIRIGVGLETLGKKIYLLGGHDGSGKATKEVYCCHFPFKTWDNKTTSLPIARCYFACEVLDKKIYTIGGLGTDDSWDTYDPSTYDPSTDNWISHEDPNLVPDIEDSVVLDGQIYIRRGDFSLSPDVQAIVHKPSRGSWQDVDADIAAGWKGPAVVIDGTLYVLDQISGLRLMKWQKESKEWVLVRSFSQQYPQPPRRLVAIGKELFVIGKGLGTLMFHVDQSENAGEMVESSIPMLTSDYDVTSCKALAV